MANTVGNANFKITLTGDPVVTSALPLTLGGRAIPESERKFGAVLALEAGPRASF
jgi:hypothetical protein